ncbi:MAG: diguanylate cyclase [Caldilineaceae bacterium]
MEPNLLLQVLQISQRMASMRAFEPLLIYVIDEAIQLAGAERGYLILLRDDGTLALRVQRDQQGNDTHYGLDEISMTVFQKVITTYEPLVLTDASGDTQFSLAHSVQKLRLRSLMCAPLLVQGKTLGAIYVENRSLRGRFKEENLIPLGLFANQAAVAIENAALHQELEAKVAERTASLQAALAQLTAQIVEKQRIEEDLRRLASHDPLTGALNRRSFYEQGEGQFALARASHLPLSVLLLDLDRFKQINDRYGHLAGDAVLTRFAGLCRSHLREGHLFGRLGGEEFAMLLPHCDEKVAFNFGERICTACLNMCTHVNQKTIDVTVSIGVATLDSTDDSFDALLDRADQSMYLSKKRGGNLVTVFPHSSIPHTSLPSTLSMLQPLSAMIEASLMIR